MGFIWSIIILLASSVLEGLLQKKPVAPKPAALADFQIPQITEDTPQPVVFGDCWTQSWQVLWYGDLRSVAIKAKGGKK